MLLNAHFTLPGPPVPRSGARAIRHGWYAHTVPVSIGRHTCESKSSARSDLPTFFSGANTQKQGTASRKPLAVM